MFLAYVSLLELCTHPNHTQEKFNKCREKQSDTYPLPGQQLQAMAQVMLQLRRGE
jgi:hypothetical protein